MNRWIVQLAGFSRAWTLLCVAALGVLGVPFVVHAHEADQAPDAPRAVDPFVTSAQHVLRSVVAIGTYNRNTRPTVGYFGSGFVIGDGTYVITNAHVVDAIRKQKLLPSLRVYPPRGGPDDARQVTLVAEDFAHDLALLKMQGPAMMPLTISDQIPRPGHTVGVVGFPVGMSLGAVPAVHKGVVSAVVPAVLPLPAGKKLTRELEQAIRDPYNLYQLDLLVFPGHSGSPLFDANTGSIVGVINKTLASRTREHLLNQPTAIAYAIPVKWVIRLCGAAGVELN